MTRVRNAVIIRPSGGGRRNGLVLSIPLTVFVEGFAGLVVAIGFGALSTSSSSPMYFASA